MPLTKNDDVTAIARHLGPQIRAVREEAEELRQTPPALADALAEAGLYQMYLPRSVGGPEMSPLTASTPSKNCRRLTAQLVGAR